jgi:hypothetical protein
LDSEEAESEKGILTEVVQRRCLETNFLKELMSFSESSGPTLDKTDLYFWKTSSSLDASGGLGRALERVEREKHTSGLSILLRKVRLQRVS